jgi:hypothetical protein
MSEIKYCDVCGLLLTSRTVSQVRPNVHKGVCVFIPNNCGVYVKRKLTLKPQQLKQLQAMCKKLK